MQSLQRLPRKRPYAWLPVLIVVITVFALAVGAIALHYLETRLVATTGESLSLAAAEIADKLSRTLSERHKDAQMLARTLMARSQNTTSLTEYLAWIKKSSGTYSWLGVTDQDGRLVAATDPAAVGLDLSKQVWFQSVRDGRTVHVGDVQPDVVTGGVDAVTFTAPITGPEEKFLGAVTTRVTPSMLEDTVTQTIRVFQERSGSLGKIEYQFMTYNGDVFVDTDLEHKGKVNLKRLGLPSALLSETLASRS